jgi:class 3 adenylate cyclase
MYCSECAKENPDKAKFCNECGFKFSASPADQHLDPSSSQGIEGERKNATILFSDLSGYTAMTEKMDPEEVKTLMEDIFEKAGKIVDKYQGTVDSFFGDEILVLFGVPKAHEDDPVRAIHTAMEIHELVDRFSKGFEKKFNARLSMHTGINTGLIVTGDKFIGKDRQGLAGDAINLASRLTGIAKPGEIVIGNSTFQKAGENFLYEEMEPVAVKGKIEPVKIFKVKGIKKISEKGDKTFTRQISSKMVGRDRDINKLELQVAKVINDQGSVINIIGEAGIGQDCLQSSENLKSLTKQLLWKANPYQSAITCPFIQ